MAQDAKPGDRRSARDNLMLIVFVLCMGIALVRVALVVATVPYAAYVSQRKIAEAKTVGKPAPSTPLLVRIARSGPFVSWWGGRRIPRSEGGDYLGVLSHQSIARSLGCVTGTLVQRDRAKGLRIDRVIVPADRLALYGRAPGSLFTLADGSKARTQWGPLWRDIRAFSEVPVSSREYDPLLTADQAARLDKTAGLVERVNQYYIGKPLPGGSGTWILHVRVGKQREYLLIPLESSPASGAL